MKLKLIVLVIASYVLSLSAHAQNICQPSASTIGALTCPVGVGGVKAGNYVKLNSTGTAVVNGSVTDNASQFLGVALQTTAGGQAVIKQVGQQNLNFDGATVSGDAFTISPSNPGQFHDQGTSTYGVASLGTVQATIGSAGTVLALLGSGSGGGTALPIACVGSPGNTVGQYRQQCQTTAGVIYACNNSVGCTVAADWIVGGGPQGPTGAGYAATSTTSLTIATGSTTLTTQSGLAYSVGALIQITCIATPSEWMYGTVTSYSGTTLVFNSTLTGGSGTCAAWSINLGSLSAGQNTAFSFCYNPTGASIVTSSSVCGNSTTGFTISAAVHGQGPTAFAVCGGGAVSCSAPPDPSGNLTFAAMTPALTGTGYVYGGGSGAATVYVNGGTTNEIPYYAATGVQLSPLSSCASGVWQTNSSGVPACSPTLPSGQIVANPQTLYEAYPVSDLVCAHGGDTTLTNYGPYTLACNNALGTDSVIGSAQGFSSTYTFPANTFVLPSDVRIEMDFGFSSNVTTPPTLTLEGTVGSTVRYESTGVTITAGLTNYGFLGNCKIAALTAASSSSYITDDCSFFVPGFTNSYYTANTKQLPIAATNGTLAWNLYVFWAATGLKTATYVSGGTISDAGSTCTLGSFSSGTGAAATIAISGGTPGTITVTNTGYNMTGTSGTATLSGTGCSGTVSLSWVLGGAQGNAIQLRHIHIFNATVPGA